MPQLPVTGDLFFEIQNTEMSLMLVFMFLNVKKYNLCWPLFVLVTVCTIADKILLPNSVFCVGINKP